MSKYTLIKKSTGKFYQVATMWDDTSKPINTDELQFVELTERMVNSLTNHNEVIDYNNTIFQNGSWTEVFVTPQKVDILASRTIDKNNFLKEAQRRLALEDITDSYKEKLEDYIQKLNAITPTNNEIQQINWPVKPF